MLLTLDAAHSSIMILLSLYAPHSLCSSLFMLLTLYAPHSLRSSLFTLITLYAPHSLCSSLFSLLNLLTPQSSLFSLLMPLTSPYLNVFTACNCESTGSRSNFCDSITGQCPCTTLAYGRRCSECQPGYYGFPNCQPCKCNGHAVTCNSLTGVCLNCTVSTEKS